MVGQIAKCPVLINVMPLYTDSGVTAAANPEIFAIAPGRGELAEALHLFAEIFSKQCFNVPHNLFNRITYSMNDRYLLTSGKLQLIVQHLLIEQKPDDASQIEGCAEEI